MAGGLLVWTWPPAVNEAHYLGKAKHFWNADWCGNDLFAGSHETHWLFYLSAGWPSRFFPLTATAWLGRLAAWLVTAWGLVCLWRVFDPRGGSVLLAIPLTILLNRYFHLAGEWFWGGIEGKSLAWGFVFAGVAAWLQSRWNRCGLCLAIACGFHVVLGMWTLVAIALASIAGRMARPVGDSAFNAPPVVRGRPLIWILAGLFIFSGVLPALQLNTGMSGQDIARASEIQAFGRLAHHQDAMQFEAGRWIGFLALIAIWGLLIRHTWRNRTAAQSGFNRLVAAALVLDLAGWVLSLTAWAAPETRPWISRFLVLYWFRLADVLVPLGVVVNAWFTLSRLPVTLRKGLAGSVAILLLLAVGQQFAGNLRDPRSGSTRQASGRTAPIVDSQRDIQADRNWQSVCHWISRNTPSNAVFVTPANQQTFKWYADRAEVANWKDMPQDAAGVIEWHDRLNRLYRVVPQSEMGILGLFNHEILQIAEDYGADYLIVETRFVDRRQQIGYPTGFQQIWPRDDSRRSTWTVFRLPRPVTNRDQVN